jgi:hypothetical protein
MLLKNILVQELEKINVIYRERSLKYSHKVSLINHSKTANSIKFKFRVHGSDIYTVQILVANDEVNYMCNCPCFDSEDECKHVAACLSYLIQNSTLYESSSAYNASSLDYEHDIYANLLAQYEKIRRNFNPSEKHKKGSSRKK